MEVGEREGEGGGKLSLKDPKVMRVQRRKNMNSFHFRVLTPNRFPSFFSRRKQDSCTVLGEVNPYYSVAQILDDFSCKALLFRIPVTPGFCLG